MDCISIVCTLTGASFYVNRNGICMERHCVWCNVHKVDFVFERNCTWFLNEKEYWKMVFYIYGCFDNKQNSVFSFSYMGFLYIYIYTYIHEKGKWYHCLNTTKRKA